VKTEVRTALARASSNCKRQAHPLFREDVTWELKPQVFSWKQSTGSESQGAWRQDELILGKPPIVK
jgi:hypothetical protein